MTELPHPRAPARVRHPLKLRLLTVVSTTWLTPTMRRIVVGGDGLEDFTSLGFDDHVKLFPIAAGETVSMPALGPDGPIFDGPPPLSRDYTPRRHDAEAGHLTLDFVMGHDGPATDWARTADVGASVGVGGPRGSFIVPTAYADHVLIGDETALPAIARRLEELPATSRAWVVVEIASAVDRLDLRSAAETSLTWVERGAAFPGDPDALRTAVRAALASTARQDAFVWVAAEAGVAKALRADLVAMGFDPRSMKAAAYWRRGDSGVHEAID